VRAAPLRAAAIRVRATPLRSTTTIRARATPASRGDDSRARDAASRGDDSRARDAASPDDSSSGGGGATSSGEARRGRGARGGDRDDVADASPQSNAGHDFERILDSATDDARQASYELYGYFLGDGWLDVGSATTDPGRGAIRFAPTKAKDWDYLDALLFRLRGILDEPVVHVNVAGRRGDLEVDERPTPWTRHLQNGQRHYESGETPRGYYIFHRGWFACFYREYYPKYRCEGLTRNALAELEKWGQDDDNLKDPPPGPGAGRWADLSPGQKVQRIDPPSAKSAKWLMPWVLPYLKKEYLRDILRGLRFADGNQSHEKATATDCGEIYMSDVPFRDDVVRMAIHAGYSARFRAGVKAGTDCGLKPADRSGNRRPGRIVTKHDAWIVTYTDTQSHAAPFLKMRDVAKEEASETSVWSVRLPAGSSLMARRVLRRDENGRAVEVSRPFRVGAACLEERVSVV
jgi:hypothetical protein